MSTTRSFFFLFFLLKNARKIAQLKFLDQFSIFFVLLSFFYYQLILFVFMVLKYLLSLERLHSVF